jgi:hypothetical protein
MINNTSTDEAHYRPVLVLPQMLWPVWQLAMVRQGRLVARRILVLLLPVTLPPTRADPGITLEGTSTK